MAQLELVSNLLYVISGNEPTTENLPEGCCAFGTVDGKNVLYANIEGVITILNDRGSGIVYSTATTTTTTTSLNRTTLSSSEIAVEDLVISSNSMLFKITALGSTTVTVSYLVTIGGSSAQIITSLNGTTTTGRSIYAPQTYGAAGYELIGNGANSVPLWKQPTGYMTCSTAATTVAKTVSRTNFKLVTGIVIGVKFTYAHRSTTAATLNVNSTGAKTIVWDNSSVSITMPSQSSPTEAQKLATHYNSWEANETLTLAYDGTYWRIIARNKPPMYSEFRSIAATYQATKQVVRMVLPAGKKYLLTSTVNVNISDSGLIMNRICVDDNSANRLVTSMDGRGSAYSGGGVTNAVIADCTSQTSAVLAYIESYCYMDTTYQVSGNIYAVIIGE